VASICIESKDLLIAREKLRMQRELPTGSWSIREKIALACRILHSQGHESGLAGQVSARESERTFLTQRLGCGLREVRASALLTADEELNVVEGEGMPNPANRFHGWLYRARPDVHCIVHTHPLYSSALSTLGVPLVISHMDSCALYDNVAFLERWPGVPVGDEEGRLISTALGNRSALLLAHHGLLVTGRTVEEACVLAVQFERAARLQMIASGSGSIRPIARELALEARDWLLNPRRSEATFAYYARAELARDPQCTT
jgi:L-fuculose-phosphate aldolase